MKFSIRDLLPVTVIVAFVRRSRQTNIKSRTSTETTQYKDVR